MSGDRPPAGRTDGDRSEKTEPSSLDEAELAMDEEGGSEESGPEEAERDRLEVEWALEADERRDPALAAEEGGLEPEELEARLEGYAPAAEELLHLEEPPLEALLDEGVGEEGGEELLDEGLERRRELGEP